MGVLSLRTGIGFVAVIAAFEVLQMQAVLDALLLFGAAGIVPGTNIQLSPDATLWTLGGFLALSIALIFHKDIIVALMSPATMELPMLPVIEDTAHTKPAKPFAIQMPHIVLPKAGLRIKLSPVVLRLNQAIALLKIWLHKGHERARPMIASAQAAGIYSAGKTVVFLAIATKQIVRHARQFDAWATAKIQQQDSLAEVQKLLRESTKVCADWCAKAFTSAKNLLQK